MSTKKKKNIDIVDIPENVEVEIDGNMMKFKGQKGTLEKKFLYPSIKISRENNAIKLEPVKKYTKKEKRMIKTFKSHIKNCIIGVTEGFSYHLRIVSGHFPMSVVLEHNKIVIKNFLGEKFPRIAQVHSHVKAVIKGDDITIEGIDKEATGQSAANLETATRITNRDRRRFQDGIYITQKPERHKK